MIEWLNEQGYSVVQVTEMRDATMNTICLAAVPSVFNPGGYHMVVGRVNKNGKVCMLHDPNKKNKSKVGKKLKWVCLYFVFSGGRYDR